jgi:hypothetical protein
MLVGTKINAVEHYMRWYINYHNSRGLVSFSDAAELATRIRAYGRIIARKKRRKQPLRKILFIQHSYRISKTMNLYANWK